MPATDQIDAFVMDGLERLGIPGASIGVVQQDKVVHLRGFGQIGHAAEPVTPQTPFQLASLTKSFTALVVLQLAAEGHLSIDDPVVAHMPYFQTADPRASRQITIRHLLNHRSGITTLDGNRYQRTRYRGADATGRAVRRLASAKLQAPPGARFQYSNANYATLAHLIETLEQEPLEDVLERRVFSPLGMANTYAQVPRKPVAAPAKGHLQWFGLAREDHIIAGRMMMGAGGVVSSAEDMAKYLIALSAQDPRIVPQAFADAWQNKGANAYIFGSCALRAMRYLAMSSALET
ncbi:MAG: serine hydrolase domain-containing protein, partial [Pseudomonadota bacterium]